MYCAHIGHYCVAESYMTVQRREYLENLGSHDPVFGCCMDEVCLAKCGAQRTVSIVVLVTENWRET